MWGSPQRKVPGLGTENSGQNVQHLHAAIGGGVINELWWLGERLSWADVGSLETWTQKLGHPALGCQKDPGGV